MLHWAENGHKTNIRQSFPDVSRLVKRYIPVTHPEEPGFVVAGWPDSNELGVIIKHKTHPALNRMKLVPEILLD